MNVLLIELQHICAILEQFSSSTGAVSTMAEYSSDFTLPLLEWLDIPAGRVALGDNIETFNIKPFKIAKYPVTNAQFQAFIQDGGYKNNSWWEGLAQAGGAPRASDWPDLERPKLQVCWYEAIALCRWLTHTSGFAVLL